MADLLRHTSLLTSLLLLTVIVVMVMIREGPLPSNQVHQPITAVLEEHQPMRSVLQQHRPIKTFLPSERRVKHTTAAQKAAAARGDIQLAYSSCSAVTASSIDTSLVSSISTRDVIQTRWPPPEVQLSNTPVNISTMPAPKYSPSFTNPCWYEQLDSTTPYYNNTSYRLLLRNQARTLSSVWSYRLQHNATGWRLRCLPYFYLIGQPKSGTTDLFFKLNLHPSIMMGKMKEPHWWTRKRFASPSQAEFSEYLDLFDQSAECIHMTSRVTAAQQKRLKTQDVILGEGSASTFWDNAMFHRTSNSFHDLPATQPTGTRRRQTHRRGSTPPPPSAPSAPLAPPLVPHLISHIQPHARFILILRDPVQRTYSDYLYFHQRHNKSQSEFHEHVTSAINQFTSCTNKLSERECAYLMQEYSQVRLTLGLYSIYLSDWLSVVPRDQIYVLTLEEYSANRRRCLVDICHFLGVDGSLLPDDINHQSVSNARRVRVRHIGDMWTDTCDLLTRFYQPYNHRLAEMLGDRKYLWKSTGG